MVQNFKEDSAVVVATLKQSNGSAQRSFECNTLGDLECHWQIPVLVVVGMTKSNFVICSSC